MASFSQLPSGSWRVHIRRAGFPTIVRTFKTRPEAEAFALVEEGGLIRRRADVPHSLLKSSFSNVVAAYFKSPAFKNKASSTRTRELSASKPVLEYFKDYDLAVIKPSDIQRYFDDRHDYQTYRKKPISGDTLRIEKAFLSSIFNFGVLRDYCSSNPTKHLRFEYKKPTPRDARLGLNSDQLMDRLFSFEENSPRLNPCFIPFVIVLYATGMRPGELSRLKFEYVELESSRIRIPRSANKTRNERILSFTKGLFRMLFEESYFTAREAGSPYLFYSVNPSGDFVPLSYAKPMQRFIKHMGLPSEFVAHSFRHERISSLFESTKFTESQIALMMGDVNPMSLLRYRHLQMERLKGEASDALIDFLDDGNDAVFSLKNLTSSIDRSPSEG